MNEFIFYDYLYDYDEIVNLKNSCSTSQWIREEKSGKRYYCSPQNYLDQNVMIEKYLKYLPEYVATSLHEGITKCLEYFPDLKLAKYEENDLFDWHCDYWTENKSAQNYMKRQISSITYLNIKSS
jgi:hypothetical protein